MLFTSVVCIYDHGSEKVKGKKENNESQTDFHIIIPDNVLGCGYEEQSHNQPPATQ